MNKKQKFYSLIILVVTFISISVMVFYNSRQYSYGDVKIPDEKLKVSNSKNNEESKKENEKENRNSVIKANDKVDESNEIEQGKAIDQGQEERSNLSYNNTVDESIYNTDDNIRSSDNQTVPAVSIFKVDKDTIPNKISIQDKAKLLFIARKLSVADCDDIKNDLNSSDEMGASKDIFTILKKKLSSKDYNNVKKILSPYINMDYIDENIDN